MPSGWPGSACEPCEGLQGCNVPAQQCLQRPGQAERSLAQLAHANVACACCRAAVRIFCVSTPHSTERHPCACCRDAVQAFCGSVHAGLGGNASLAVGPLGRQADAVMRMGTKGAALCYSYSCSRGAYAGGLLCTDSCCSKRIVLAVGTRAAAAAPSNMCNTDDEGQVGVPVLQPQGHSAQWLSPLPHCTIIPLLSSTL